ncbi:MAG: ComEC family competence protein [Flavobacteriaceae bacterium]|nr:ComEC family competence protein [Flavobacteriaceae bacterium]
MRKILRFIPIQLTFFLVLGILFGFYFDVKIDYLVIILIGLLTVLGFSYWQSNKSFSPNLSFNILTYVLSFFLGISTVVLHNDLNNQQHYSHFISDNNEIVLVVDKVMKSGNYHDKYEVYVLKIDAISTKGKVLLNIQKDSLSRLQVDDKLYLKSDFKEVNSPKNPFTFDYKEYLKKKQIYHQLFTSNSDFFPLPKRTFSFKGLAAKFRSEINKALIKNGFKDDELGVINALLLGQRQDISPELLQSYAGAGAIHILAVSGLHVGIILLILNFLFSPLERLKNGKFIKLIVVVSLLWVFAFIAGMSASVVRAVTMFTAVAIGMQVNRPTNVYNTLVISMFFLLLFKPSFLFDVGFQLSYLAVFFIVWLQPLLYNLWIPKWKVPDFFWKLLTVSIAAQFGVIPLSLYYFHQFPSLFFISNLVIIPALGTILVGGILIIALSLLDVLPVFLAKAYEFVIHLMNWIVDWVAQQEDFLFQDISFSLLMVIASYILIIFTIRFFEKRNAPRLIGFLTMILLLQVVFMYEKRERLSANEFIVFQKSRNSIIAERNGKKLKVYHTLDSLNLPKDKVINQYKVGVGNSTIYMTDSVPNIYQFKNKNILIIDSLGIYQVNSLKPEIVILQQSPKINLTRLIDSIKPQLIIADGSNYKSYVKKWQETCEQKNTPFYHTGQKGAYILK